ncbi:MAG: hypothetical protein QQN41_01355 [Nitrosopumilus sp.]
MNTVKKIINWSETDSLGSDGLYEICVEMQLKNDKVFIGLITKTEFDRMKDEELQHEIQQLIDSASIRHGLCAWCKSYFNRQTGKAIHKLTDEQFEQTRHTGQSHGCCDSCGKTLKESTAKINIDIEINNQ